MSNGAYDGDDTAIDASGKPKELFSARSRASRIGLALQPGIEFERWRKIGVQVGTLADASAWWIGDWLIFGQRAFPDRYRSAIEATGFSYQTLRNYAWVAGQFPVYRRRDNLSFGHHAEVASLDEEHQEIWLVRAASRGWSRNVLRNELRAASGRDRGAVAIALKVDEQHHARWQAAAVAHSTSLFEWMTEVLDAAATAAIEASTATA